MADPAAVAFELLLVSIAAVFLGAYVAFARMNPDIRRARLFIMASRIHRFLLAFTVGFVTIVVFVLAGLIGITLDRSVAAAAVFFSFGAMLYGSVEILLIAHPTRTRAPQASVREEGESTKERG